MDAEFETIESIKKHAIVIGRIPTVHDFASAHNTHAASIIRRFGSWNELLRKAGFQPNKSNKRTKEQLIGWLKIHPDARYNEMPLGIRNRLEEEYGTIANARKVAGLAVIDWRSSTKRRKYTKPVNSGRPIEYSHEMITNGLRELAIVLGRPPRMKDISKKKCGFTMSSVAARFGSLNSALMAASLPASYSHNEIQKMTRDLECLMMNIKLKSNDVPLTFNKKTEKTKILFKYKDRNEFLVLKRSDISTIAKDGSRKSTIWFLVDDSLDDVENIDMRCIMDLNIDKETTEEILKLRKQFDDISRKYVGQPFVVQTNSSATMRWIHQKNNTREGRKLSKKTEERG